MAGAPHTIAVQVSTNVRHPPVAPGSRATGMFCPPTLLTQIMNAESRSPADIAGCLRLALRSLVRPVAVITAAHAGERYAMAATAFCEVSMDPPSMLVCVNRTNTTYKAISEGADIGLNLLSERQAEISQAAGGAKTATGKFAVGNWIHEDGKPPRLADCCAAMVLRPTQVVDQGTHAIVIGEIVEIQCQLQTAPLAFHEGDYMFPLATALLNLAIAPDPDGTAVTRAHDFLIMRLMAAFYWFDEGMQAALQRRGWGHVSRSESMVFANMAMGINRTDAIAHNLGLPQSAIDQILADMQARELVATEPAADAPGRTIVRYSARANKLRSDAMAVLEDMEAIVGERIGRRAVQALRATLSQDWGEIPNLPPARDAGRG